MSFSGLPFLLDPEKPFRAPALDPERDRTVGRFRDIEGVVTGVLKSLETLPTDTLSK